MSASTPVANGSLPAIAPSLVAETAAHYGVGPAYATAYLEYWQRARQRVHSSLQEILRSESPYPMWFDFAMSTNARAARFRDFLVATAGTPAGRYLDVGCGFGGYLRAFAELGMEPTGIEIDADRIALSRANAADGGLGDCVHQLDILAGHGVERLGRFDLITCIDVIEHVLDVPLALRRLAELLAPGGLLCLEIPNKDSVGFVTSDGHFNLFGITQLSRRDAIEYHRRHFQFEYDVGHYFAADYYRERLAELGLEASYAPYPAHPARPVTRLPRLLGGLGVGYLRYCAKTMRRLPFGVNAKLHGALAGWGTRMIGGAAMAVLRRDATRFRARYLTDFWLLMARKPMRA
jgi:2-polyprenyl-3-methyl-5-hydroxy-6-metoxy-1,4-benzoquinol methylase